MAIPPEQPAPLTALDTDDITELAEALAAAGERVGGAAGGLPRTGPDVPYDWFDLGTRIRALDEAREAFDHRVAGLLRGLSGAAASQVDRTVAVDHPG